MNRFPADAPAKSPLIRALERDLALDPDKPAPVQPATDAPASDTQPAEDLRALIGVKPGGLKRVEAPRLPSMSLRGYVAAHGKEPMALLEIAELKRTFLVQLGTEIPITVAGRLSPVGRGELTGLNDPNSAPSAQARAADEREQSQLILRVKKVSSEGVTVETGVLAQTLIIR